ncbi:MULTISPECIES: hypothetical protein [unclassified Streptomyces]|uniref:hypothetical protein n=1 Tax=unclassified Streptomyces TaxID=2593676 RepID=UPI001BAF55C9|nr:MULTISPECIES: hypothetical protein [unclassified Streptomyces]QUC62487.1 hypothetical protein IOD14_40170 [Streptomyces sp. A2-16]
MTAGRKSRKGREPRPCPSCSAAGVRPPEASDRDLTRNPTHNSLVQQGMASNAASSRLRKISGSETDDRIRQRHAHVDDLIRVFRNVAAMAVFALVTLTVVAYAGIKAGIPPEACVVGGVTSASLLVRAFTRIFDVVRSSLPDAPVDRPSNDER